MAIHPTAIVGKNVSMGSENEIGPYAIIEDGVKLGSHNKILARSYVCAGTELGDRNEIHMGAIVGHAPQDFAYQNAKTGTLIGNDNVIREYATIHRGTKEGTKTVIGDKNYLMAYSHVAHNCEIGNQVVMVNGATLGGYCIVEDQVFLSGMIVFHQFTRIGRLAIVSGLSAVNANVPPFMMCGGRGAIAHGINIVGMRRAGISPGTRDEIKRAYRLLYQSDLNTGNALEEIERVSKSPEVAYLVEFIRNSKRGIIGGGNSREAEAIRF